MANALAQIPMNAEVLEKCAGGGVRIPPSADLLELSAARYPIFIYFHVLDGKF